LAIDNVSIRADDGLELAATIVSPQSPPQAVIQFHAGTVIRKEFYFKFATYLAECDYVVVLFDYRGVGGSRPAHLKGFQAAISDWGEKDAPAVTAWIKRQYPDLSIYLFAHSMGGQLIGLMYNWSLFEKITVVASSSGNWHNFKPSYYRRVKWSTELSFSINLRLLGYVPGRFGLGQDWPKGVAKDWWYNSRQNGLMADYMDKKCENTYYREIDKGIAAYFISDDHMATPRTIPNYARSYPNANVITHLIEPSSYDFEEIGHFGLFKEWSKGKLWDDVISSLS